MLRVAECSGVLKMFEGSILVMMMGDVFCFATVTSEFVWIRFRLAVRRLAVSVGRL